MIYVLWFTAIIVDVCTVAFTLSYNFVAMSVCVAICRSTLLEYPRELCKTICVGDKRHAIYKINTDFLLFNTRAFPERMVALFVTYSFEWSSDWRYETWTDDGRMERYNAFRIDCITSVLLVYRRMRRRKRYFKESLIHFWAIFVRFLNCSNQKNKLFYLFSKIFFMPKNQLFVNFSSKIFKLFDFGKGSDGCKVTKYILFMDHFEEIVEQKTIRKQPG